MRQSRKASFLFRCSIGTAADIGRCKITGRQITITGCGGHSSDFSGTVAAASGSGSRSVMLLRPMPSVEALCSSAEVVGGRMPATPRKNQAQIEAHNEAVVPMDAIHKAS